MGSPRRGFFLDVGITFRTSQPNRSVILFDKRLAPRACAYLIVIDGVGTLAVLLTQQFKHARAMLEGGNYEDLIAQEIRPLVQSSLINRALYDCANNSVYRTLIRHLCARQDVHCLLHLAYQSRRIRRVFWPWVARSLSGGMS